MIPFGIGILVATILMNISYSTKVDFDIETKARKMGMIYPSEIKAIELDKGE